mmetsp:Transcript_9611/g.23801  ORF Transcript_9611/g.23801 Transcript_9611/m.23801 type:complete len:259 (-) Transcript_9611:702-1478(-)
MRFLIMRSRSWSTWSCWRSLCGCSSPMAVSIWLSSMSSGIDVLSAANPESRELHARCCAGLSLASSTPLFMMGVPCTSPPARRPDAPPAAPCVRRDASAAAAGDRRWYCVCSYGACCAPSSLKLLDTADVWWRTEKSKLGLTMTVGFHAPALPSRETARGVPFSAGTARGVTCADTAETPRALLDGLHDPCVRYVRVLDADCLLDFDDSLRSTMVLTGLRRRLVPMGTGDLRCPAAADCPAPTIGTLTFLGMLLAGPG